MRIAQEGKYYNLIPPDAISSAAMSTAYVKMATYDHVDFVITFKSCSSIASDVVSLKQAINTSGSSSANLVVDGYWSNKAALGSASIANDTYVWTAKSSMSSSGAKFKLASNSTDNQVYIIPVDANMITTGTLNHLTIHGM